MSLTRRLFANSIASAGSIFWSALAQLFSTPILAHFWGVNNFGIWLMITTIPTYFALSDLGFSSAATSDMNIAFARGEFDHVLKTYQSVWLLLLIISAGLLILCSPLAILPMLHMDFGLPWMQHALAIFILIAYGAAALCSRVILGGFRAIGHYSIGTLIYDFIQFLETVGILLAALLSGGFVWAAILMLALRICNILVMTIVLKFLAPWLHLGVRYADTGELKRLFRPAMRAMALPSVMALNLQGVTMIAGIVVSPLAAAVLGPVRTISRITIQMVGIVNRATIPEFSTAYGKGDSSSLQRIIKFNSLSIFAILLPGAVLFSIFGATIVKLWSGGKIDPSPGFVVLMACGMFAQGLWVFSANLLQAINRLDSFVKILAPSAILAVLLAIPLGRYWGLNGIATAVLLGEIGSVVGAYISFMEISKEPIFQKSQHAKVDG